MRALQNILLLVGFLCIAYAVPGTSSFRCSRYCKEEKSSFGYEIGKLYVYSYKGAVRNLINSTSAGEVANDESGISFTCSVKINVLSACDFVMKISDVRMEDYYIKNRQKITGKVEESLDEMEMHPLYFSFNNGKIETICSTAQEVKNVLNLKRAILSAFQNSAQGLEGNSLVYETDISGTCVTQYETNKTEKGFQLKKTKNLDACTYRMSQYLSWQSVPYSRGNKIKSLPLLRSSSVCQQKYSLENILSSSVCEEKHVFRPFSNGDSGALTAVKQEMNILSIGNANEFQTSLQNAERFTLIYENEKRAKPTVDMDKILETFQKIDNKTIDYVDKDAPILFSQVTYSFRYLTKDEFMFIFHKLKSRQRKIYIDAISITTTTSAVEVMKQLFDLQEVSTKQTNSWITFLSFTKNPAIELISSLAPFLLIKDVREKSVLAVSSLIHRYCQTDTNCLDKEPILNVLKEIEKPLEKNSDPMGVVKNRQILLALKGIGNAGITTSLNLLRAHYMNGDNLVEIRLAAIAAHRRMSCSSNSNLDDFNSYFADVRLNTEMRIASYLAMMKCASYASIAQIKDVLLHEDSNQVGSFVWTHLTNLQETAAQWKQGLKKLLENEFLKNKFHTDIRKYSRNYEASTFFDSFGVGGSIESNIIFTPDSYLPRSAMFNFTMDLFGETINVFEFGTRLEGFEDIVESFFGPNGYFSDKGVRSFLENARKSHGEANEDIKRLSQQFSNSKVLKQEAAGLLYAKIFGNEFSYTHFNSLKDLIGEPVTPKDIVMLLLDLFRENDVNVTKSLVFLESSYKVPTMIGLSLELTANGTSTVGLTVKGKLDLNDLWSYKIAIEGKVSPSISIHVDGSMIVSGLNVKSGVKYSGSMNSNTYLNGHVFINSGKVIDAKMNIPNNQMDLINIASNVFIIRNNDVYKIRDISDNTASTRSCTPQTFNKLTGCEICSVLKYTNASQLQFAPHFPLTGEFKYALYTKKTDQFDSYQLQLNTQLQNNSMYAMSLYIDTPNSTINRKIVATYHLDPEKLSIQGKLISPILSFEIESSLGKDYNKYHFEFLTKYNHREIVSLQSTFKMNHVGNSFKYEPWAKFNYRHKQIASISGMVSYIEGTQYTADLKLEGVTKEPITFIGDLVFDLSNIGVTANMNSPKLNGKLEAFFKRNTEGLSITASSTYRRDSHRIHDESVFLALKINKIRGALLHKDSLILTFQGTEKPIYNTDVSLSNQRGKWYFNNNGSVTIFGTTWKTIQLFKLNNLKQHPDIAISAYLTCTEKDIDYRLALIYNSSMHLLHTQLLMQINVVQRIEFLLKYLRATPEEELHILFYYPKQRWSIDGLIDKKLGNGKYLFNFDGQLNSEGKDHKLVSIVGDYTNTSVGDVQNYNVNCSLDLPTSNGIWATPWAISFTLQKSQHIFLSFTKLETKNILYVSHLNWMKNTFSFGVQAGDKRLIVINTGQTSEAINVLLGLNIYQHFELSVNLILPYEKFDLEFYWDKDNNDNKKLVFAIEKNSYKGLYNANILYPNQKITAAFVLLPTQVTLNVTWGIVVSQKIYLKMGNKIYSVGGIWFGELETPFDYLEKQKFFLKYYVVSNNFEVYSNVSWRQHNMNLLVSGSKSKEHLKGYLRLNTTLPEISEIETAANHFHDISENLYVSNADFTYNQHKIHAESLWKLNGLNIDSNFKILSPTNTLKPLSGVLKVNNDNIKHMIFNISWQEKVISASYNLQSETSSIEITTPFEGIEKTILQYSVKANPDSVYLSVTVDLLQQFNRIVVNLKHFEKYVLFWMDLTSPVTGYYYLNFTHSTISGELKESFNVKGPKNKDIVLFNLGGHIDINIVNTKVVAFIKLLEHNASLSIVNSPLSSVIYLNLNEFTFESKLFVEMQERYQQLRWNVTTNVFDYLKVNYIHIDNSYVVSAIVFERYVLGDYMSVYKDYNEFQNYFFIKSPEAAAAFNYFHSISGEDFKQKLYAKSENKELKYNLGYNKLSGNFEVNCNFDNMQLTGYGKIDNLNSTINANIIFKTIFNVDVLLNHEILKSDQLLDLIVEINVKFNKAKWAYVKWENGYGLKKYLKLKTEYLDSEYFFDGQVFNGAVIVKLTDHNHLLADANLSSNTGFIKYNQLHPKKRASFDYKITNDNETMSLTINTISNIESLPNATLNLTFNNQCSNKDMLLTGTFNDQLLMLDNKYRVHSINQTFFMNLTGQFLYKYLQANSSIVDANVNLSINNNEFDRKGIVDIVFIDDKLQKTRFYLDFMDANNKTDTFAILQNRENIYELVLSTFISNSVFDIKSKVDVSNAAPLIINLKVIKKHNSNSEPLFSSSAFLTFKGKNYSAEIQTTVADLNSESLIKIITPTDKLLGHLKLKSNKTLKLIEFELNLPNNSVNEFQVLVENGNISLATQIDFLKIPSKKLLVHYDFVNPTAKVLEIEFFNHSKIQSVLRSIIDKQGINVQIQWNFNEKLITITGTHKLNSLRDFSFSYVIKVQKVFIKIDVLNYFGNMHQTKFDVSTNIRKWNRLAFETKFDSDKTRISLNVRNNHMGLIAKRYTGKWDEVLFIQLQGETLLEIWTGGGQTTIRTSSRFGIYRLFIQYTEDPGIYAFSILKDGENVISLMLQDFSTNTYFDLKGKLIAPDLIPIYSNLSLLLHVDYDLPKSLQFQIYNSLTQLFELKWYTRLGPPVYTGYFKFNTIVPILPDFEVNPTLNISEDFSFNTHLIFKNKNGIKNRVFITMILPKANSEAKFSLIYPCAGKSICDLIIHFKPKYVNINWASPFTGWRNISLNMYLQDPNLNAGIVSGALRIRNDTNYFISVWSYRFKQDVMVRLNVEENFYSSSIDFNVKQENGTIKNNFVLNHLRCTNEIDFNERRLSIQAHYANASFEAKCIATKDTIELTSIKDNQRVFDVIGEKKQLSGELKLFWNFISNYDGRISYDLYDPQKLFINGFWLYKENETSLLWFDQPRFQIYNASVHFKANFLSGDIDVYRKSFDLETVDEISWIKTNHYIALDWKRNNDSTGLVVNHFIGESSVNCSLIVSGAGRKMELLADGKISGGNTIEGCLLFKSPLPSVSEFTEYFVLTYSQSNYHIYNSLTWSDNGMLTLNASADFNDMWKLDADITSSFMRDSRFLLLYEKSERINFNFESKLGDEFLNLSSLIVPEETIDFNLNTTFEPFQNIRIKSNFNKKEKKIVVDFINGNSKIIMLGDFVEKPDGFKIIMQGTYPDGEVIAQGFLIHDISNLNASFQYINEGIRMRVGLDNKNYYLSLKTPYEYAKNVELAGMYKSDGSGHDLKTTGYWNQFPINIVAELRLINDQIKMHTLTKIGSNYQGEANLTCFNSNRNQSIEFVAYFPNRQSYTYAKFDKSNDTTTLILKSPFKSLHSLNLQTKINLFEKTTFVAIGNLLEKHFSIYHLFKINSSSLTSNLLLKVPDKEVSIQTDMNYNTGYFTLNDKSGEAWNHIKFNYTLGEDRFKIDVILNNDRYNSTHKLITLFKYFPDLEGGIILNEFKFIVNKSQLQNRTEAKIFATIPNLSVQNTGISLTVDSNKKLYDLSLFYNENVINSTLEVKKRLLRNQICVQIPKYITGYIKTVANSISSGFEIVSNITCNENRLNVLGKLINNDEIFELTNVLEHNRNDLYHIYVEKNLNTIEIKTLKYLTLKLTNGEIGKASLFLFNLHKIDMELSNNLYVLKLESPFLAREKIEINIRNIFENTRFISTLNYLESTDLKYNGSFILSLIEDKYFLSGCAYGSNEKLIELLFECNPNIHNHSSSIYLNVLGAENSADFNLNFIESYRVKLDFKSPYLQNGRFLVEASNLNSSQFFIGDYATGNYFRYESVFKQELMTIQIKCPKFVGFKELRLNIIWELDKSLISRNYLKISDSYLYGDVIVQANYILLDEFLDIETHLQVPFLKGFETFDAKVYLPKEFRPLVEIKLPNNVTYSLHFNYTINNDLVLIDAGFEWQTKFLLKFILNQNELNTSITIPFTRSDFINLDIKNGLCRVDIKTGTYILKSNYINSESQKALSLHIQTPLIGYELYSLELEYEIERDKVLKALVDYPGAKRKIGVEFHLALENMFKLIYNIYLPRSINGFDFGEFYIVNIVDSNKSDPTYHLECQASTNSNKLNLNLNVTNIDTAKRFLINTVINNKQMLLLNVSLAGEDFDKLDLDLKFKFPLKRIQNAHISLNTSTELLFKHSTDIFAIINNKRLINSYLYIDRNKMSLVSENIWLPFNLEYKYVRGANLDIYGKYCWNLRKQNESQIGGHLFMGVTQASASIIYPSFYLDGVINSDKSNRLWQSKLIRNNNTFVLNYSSRNTTEDNVFDLSSDAYLQLPFRIFRITQNTSRSFESPTINSSIKLIWGDENTSKFIIRNDILPGKLMSRLSTHALAHDIVFKVDMSKLNSIPSILKTQLEYCPDPDRLIEFEMFYDRINSEIFATERRFLLKHVASKIDYELHFNTLRRVDVSNGSIVLKYKNYGETNSSEAIRASVGVDHYRFRLLGEVKTKRNHFHFRAASTSGTDSHGFFVTVKVNEKDPVHLECTYHYKQISPSFNFVASYGDSRKYIFYAGLPNDREITAKLSHEMYGQHSLDSLLTVRLNTSQLLWIKVVWKKDLYPEFYKAVFQEYSDLRYVIEATGEQLIDVMNDDFGKAFIIDASEIKIRINDYVNAEKNSLQRDFERCEMGICFVFRDNAIIKKLFAPYVNFIYGLVSTMFEYRIDAIQKSTQLEQAFVDFKNIKIIKMNAKDVLKKGIKDARTSLKEMAHITITLLNDLDLYITEVKTNFEGFFEPFLNLLDDLIAYVEQRLAMFQITVLHVMDSIQKYIYNLREIKEMFNVYSSYINWLEDLHVTDVLEPIGDVIEEILETIITDIKKVTDDYKPYLDALSEVLFGKYSGLNQLPPIVELREYGNRFYQKTIWIWNYHNMTVNLKNAVHCLSKDIDDVLSFIELDDRSGDFDNPFGQTDYIIRPEIGLIEISQPLPVEWEAFSKPPAFEQHPLYQKIQRKTEQFIKLQRNNYFLIEELESFFTSLTRSTIAPPIENYAMIIGDSHFSTFHNVFYNFMSNCSYLLASDFKTDSFSLVLNYKNIGGKLRKTLEVLTERSSIEIQPKFVVLFDNKTTDLPLIMDSVKVIREKENIIIESSKGFQITCNMHYDFCTIHLSGWLFGRTGGLLGTLDNENNADLLLANKTKTNSVADFTASWKLSNNCSLLSTNNTVPPPAQQFFLKGLKKSLCSLFFSDANSPFYDCFDIVKPKPFMNVCMQNMMDETDLTTCNTIAAYRNRCKHSNILLDLPDMCLKCKGDIGVKDEILDGGNPKSVDAVFITQLNCAYNFSREILVDALKQSFNKFGYLHNRFASIGFGRNIHTYTRNNNIWSTETINNNFVRESFISQKYRAIDAIKYASNMDFRAGVGKHFVLIKCGIDVEFENLPLIYNMLGEKDITLHVLKPGPIANHSSQVVGINVNNSAVTKLGAIITSNANNEIIDGMTNVYGGLALITNGTIFEVDSIVENETMSSSWADLVSQSFRKSPCQICKCVSDSDGVGKIECNRCLTPAAKHFLSEYDDRNNINFNSN